VADSRASRRLGATAFVVAAVAATVVIASLRGQDPRPAATVHIVGAGAAPASQAAGSAAASQVSGSAPAPEPSSSAPLKVFGSNASASEVAATAAGVISDLAPLTARDFARPIASYRAYALARVAHLRAAVRRLTVALASDDRPAATAAWQDADSTFMRIGAAYGALGPLGDAIASRGLGRIESGLWSGARPASLARFGARLRVDVARLGRVLRSAAIDPLTYATRAHEILEDVQRDRLSRRTPSDSGVRATADGVAATRVVLGTLRKVLAGRGDGPAQSAYWLGRLSTTLRRIRAAHGGRYPPMAALSRAEHERLTGGVGAALEALSGIPEELETTRPPVIPRLAP
jgi:hypothetical protein